MSIIVFYAWNKFKLVNSYIFPLNNKYLYFQSDIVQTVAEILSRKGQITILQLEAKFRAKCKKSDIKNLVIAQMLKHSDSKICYTKRFNKTVMSNSSEQFMTEICFNLYDKCYNKLQ